MADEPVTRTERLLAMLVLHNMAEASKVDKCVRLNAVGFSNSDIADLIDTSSGTVATNLSAARKAKGRRKPAKATKKATKKAPAKRASKR